MNDRERTRVLRVIGRLNMGGPAHHVAVLSGRRMDSERFKSYLVHGSLAPGEESLADLAMEEGAEAKFLPDLQQPVHPIRDAVALVRLIGLVRSFRPHIVETHTAKAGFLGRSAALAVRPRPVIVHTYHGHVLEGYFGSTKSTLYKRLERMMGRFSDRLIGVSQATVDDLVRLKVAPERKFSVVPLGLDLEPLASAGEGDRRAGRAELGIEADEVLCVFVGRVVPIKRLDVMLEAFGLARLNDRRLRLAIVGDGEARGGLERQAVDLGVAGAVDFLGYRRELRSILAAADIAVLSSDNEGTPVSLIEAAAAGKPAVATEVGGVREVVDEQTGMLVPARDAPGFAEALIQMAGDGALRARLGASARERALERFGVERLLGDIDALYRELAASRSG